MGIETPHPLYSEFSPGWITMRDLSSGERVVKSKRQEYLPPTPSMVLDGFGKGHDKIGEQVYDSYIKRAQFPDYVTDGIGTLLGMLNHKKSTFTLPKKMEAYLTSCTLNGESLDDLLRRIHVEQLTTGRVGLMADLPNTTNPVGIGKSPEEAGPVLPYIVTYDAETIINWDDSGDELKFSALNLVVLNETTLKRKDNFTWELFKQYRVLQLGPIATNEPEGTTVYKAGTFDQDRGLVYNEVDMEAPSYLGKTLGEIPFVIINTRDLVGYPDHPPLEGLGQLVLAIYRGEADYRQSLFMTGQDTLVVIGGIASKDKVPGQQDVTRVGAGSKIEVDLGGDAKYVGIDSAGIPEQRSCLENDHKRAAHKAAQLLIAGKSGDQESGEALKTRYAAQNASLTQIALTAAKGLESLLKTIAVWIGADPSEVSVKANLSFGDLSLAADDFNTLASAKEAGAPISKRSLHALLRERRFTSFTYEEEVEAIKKEEKELPPPEPPETSRQNGPEKNSNKQNSRNVPGK